MLEKTAESPLDCKEIKPVNPEGNQPWIFTERTDAEAEVPIFGHLMRRADSLAKILMLGKTEGRRRRGWQDEMVGWHHRLNGHECEQTLGDSEGQGSLACYSPWGRKESDTTERLNRKTTLVTAKNVVIKPMISRLGHRRHCAFHLALSWNISGRDPVAMLLAI